MTGTGLRDPDLSGPSTDARDAVDAADLRISLGTPSWLRDLGMSAWLIVGVLVLLVGAVWILSLTNVIVMPLVAAGVLAAIVSPIISWLVRHRVPRALGAALLLLGLIGLVAGVLLAIVGGISGQTSDLSGTLSDAEARVNGWLKDLGVDPGTADTATSDASSGISEVVPALLNGVVAGIQGLGSLVLFLSFTCLSFFFFLKDGPQIRRWAERRLGVPAPVARIVTGRTLGSMRGYFVGVSAVALFNAVVVGIGALVIGVPLAATIAIVTFFAAYIPFIGAWGAGAFAVLVALGSVGADAAVAMAILVLLANSVLQQLVQPIAYGAALGIHPLAVLVVSIGGGALFGAVGLILAAPLTSAVVRISADLAKVRATGAPPSPAPAGAEPRPVEA